MCPSGLSWGICSSHIYFELDSEQYGKSLSKCLFHFKIVYNSFFLFEQGSCDDIPPPPDSSGCEFPYYFSDGICDDENNNEACDYDGGDCCGDNVDTTFCSECQCLDPDFGGSGEIF